MRCKDTKRCFKIRLPIVVVLLTAASTSLAGSGSVVSLPLPGKKVTTGLNLEINTEWVDGNGYRPVTISISPLGGGAAPADRTLDVTLRPRSHQWGVVMPNVSTTVILEQGQTVGTKIVALPQCRYDVALVVDGKDPDAPVLRGHLEGAVTGEFAARYCDALINYGDWQPD